MGRVSRLSLNWKGRRVFEMRIHSLVCVHLSREVITPQYLWRFDRIYVKKQSFLRSDDSLIRRFETTEDDAVMKMSGKTCQVMQVCSIM